jgi:hypothetical protein
MLIRLVIADGLSGRQRPRPICRARLWCKNRCCLDETVEASKSKPSPHTATQDLMAAAYEAHGITGKYIYKATLHKGKDPSEYVYLDWDKPVGLNKYKKAIKQAQSDGIRAKGAALIPFSENLTGNRLYADIVDGYRRIKADNPQREASLFLKRAGIDGIRYPSGSLSGGSGQGKNYVVFDENAITIEERKALGR